MKLREKYAFEMVELYQKGVSQKSIAEIHGVSVSTVRLRLKLAGGVYPILRSGAVPAAVDKNRLEKLYAVERLSFDRIAAELGVSDKAVRRALKYHGIPKRLSLCAGGRYLGQLRKLKIGGTAKIECGDRSQLDTLRRSARQLGILIVIQPADGRYIRVSRVSEDEPRRLSDIMSINPGQLAELYSEQKLPAIVIGRHLGFSEELIKQALDFYSIPQRVRPYKYSGKYTSVFNKLKIGESSEIECTAKLPYINLHTIATRIGIKISVHKIDVHRYQITRRL